jgi:hypothetical protein
MGADIIDFVKAGKFKFREQLESEMARTASLTEISKRLREELMAFADAIEKHRNYFKEMGLVESREILNKDQARGLLQSVYRLDTDLGYVRQLIHPESKLAGLIDNVRKFTNALKTKVATKEGATIVLDSLVPGLNEILKALDAIAKGLKRLQTEESDVLRDELAFRRLL